MIFELWIGCYIFTRVLIWIDEKLNNCHYKVDLRDELKIFFMWWIFIIIYLFGIISILLEKLGVDKK